MCQKWRNKKSNKYWTRRHLRLNKKLLIIIWININIIFIKKKGEKSIISKINILKWLKGQFNKKEYE